MGLSLAHSGQVISQNQDQDEGLVLGDGGDGSQDGEACSNSQLSPQGLFKDPQRQWCVE